MSREWWETAVIPALGRGVRGKGRRVQGHRQQWSKSEDSLGFWSSCLKYNGAGETAQQEEWLLLSIEYKPQERTNFCKLSFSLETDYRAYTCLLYPNKCIHK